MENYQETLKQAGLTDAQATVYGILLAQGKQKAGSIAKKSPLKRGLVYKALDDLVALDLVVKEEDPGKVALFEPKHPTKLRELIESRSQRLKDAELVLDGLMPSLISEFNLIAGTPGVQVYEGKEGVEKVLNDSLTSKTEILTYADIEAIDCHIAQENEAYVKKREKLDITKRGIVLDTPFAREYLKNYHHLVTETHFLKASSHPFESVMMIYDGKISYLTLNEQKKIGVIISDQQLYTLHKTLFEFIWQVTGKKEEKSEQQQEESGMLNPNFS